MDSRLIFLPQCQCEGVTFRNDPDTLLVVVGRALRGKAVGFDRGREKLWSFS